MKKFEIEKIERDILRHKELYYKGKPEISDLEFDRLEEELKILSPNSPVLKLVGSPVKSEGKIKHERKMLSLDKCYDLDKFMKWKGSHDVLSTFKIDGSSCSLIYEKGTLKTSKTRGDGIFGENIFNKTLYIDDIPKNISPKIDCEVRGEIFCIDENFLKLKKSMEEEGLDIPQSQRNIVAGILGRKDGHYFSKFLSFKSFEIYAKDFLFENEKEKMKFLEDLGFSVPTYYVNKNQKEIDKRISEARDFIESGNFLIDGLVFTFNETSFHKKLGETAHHPRFKMAFKFQGDTKITKIKKIEWGVSRNGILTPVAIVDPVELSQAMVGRVTLHNYGLVEAEKLKKGDEIEIVRSGEVIPKFLRVMKSSKEKFLIPLNCPSCGGALKKEEIRLICPNDLCPSKQLEEIQYYCSTVGIDDLSRKRLQEMINSSLVKDISSLYDVTVEDMLTLDKVKEKLATKIVSNIQKTKKIDLLSFVSALGISGGGRQKCEKIIQAGFSTLKMFLELTKKNLVEIEGFAEKSSEDFIESLEKKKKIIKKILDKGVIVSEVKKLQKSGSLMGQQFCITGTLKHKRSDVQRMIKNAGGEISSSVSKKTSYLVTNDSSGGSSKLKKAKDLKIPIINEDELYKMMD